MSAVSGGGEFWFKIESARGMAPADGLLGDGLVSFTGMCVYCSYLQSVRDGALFAPETGNVAGLILQGVQGPISNFFLLRALWASRIG